MKKHLKRLLRALVVFAIILAGFGIWKREEIQRLWAVNSLFSADKIVSNFSNMNAAFLTTPVARGTEPVSALPAGSKMTLPVDV